MIYKEDILYRAGQVVVVLLFPITFPVLGLDYFITVLKYDEPPENSIYCPPWKRRANQKKRVQDELERVQKTYAYKYSQKS